MVYQDGKAALAEMECLEHPAPEDLQELMVIKVTPDCQDAMETVVDRAYLGQRENQVCRSVIATFDYLTEKVIATLQID